jgi:hypothetical protein
MGLVGFLEITAFFSVTMSSTRMWTADGTSSWREKGDDV